MNRRTVLLSTLWFAIFTFCAHAQAVKVITGATLIDVAAGKSIPNAVIVIDGTRIVQAGTAAETSIPQGATKAETIDASGKFVIPGLADMHNHLQTGSLGPPENLKANLARLLAVGVTTVFDPSLSKADFADLKKVVAQGDYPYPNFFGTGPIITVKADRFGAAVGAPTPETVAEAQAAVKNLKAAGVDAIKIARDDLSWCSSIRMPLMKLDVLAALIKEAHDQGLRAFVHAPVLAQAKEALSAGADGLMHGILDKPVDAEFIELMKRNHATYVPTLSLYEDVADVAGWMRRQSGFDQRKLFPAAVYDLLGSPAAVGQFTAIFDKTKLTKDSLPTARANVKKVADAGIPIALGTDTGFIGVMLGVSTQLELSLMVEAGLKPVEALRAATLDAAKMIGREKEIGVVEKDHLADLVILDANPLEDIRNVRRIYRVIKSGVAYDPATR
jgi:imidazolonepropionase-like amidohydrolase